MTSGHGQTFAGWSRYCNTPPPTEKGMVVVLSFYCPFNNVSVIQDRILSDCLCQPFPTSGSLVLLMGAYFQVVVSLKLPDSKPETYFLVIAGQF